MSTTLVRGSEQPRVELVTLGPKMVRVRVDGRLVGPALTPRAARVVQRWLIGGALEDSEGGAGSKLQRTLTAVDTAWDLASDLLKNGLR
jgi:hypothetical protein